MRLSYIDLNGIIHPCFHPEEGDPPTTEREVFERILAYIDALLWVVRPRRLLYLAVDGPAPRAKMNQQRGRRFKSAAEADQKKRVEARLREEWARQGRAPPPAAAAKAAGEDPLGDSNVITPGTQFMATLGRWLRHFCYARLNNPAGYDSPSLRIILSDASVPGEGEHKAMAYIRAQRHAKGDQPNLHHCIHGLDADLLMLALATHEARLDCPSAAAPAALDNTTARTRVQSGPRPLPVRAGALLYPARVSAR
jgi:5'-3' exoribonuclease 2